ncbi:MAG: hypothetical protein PHR65_05920 [Syntrophomonadaceae bacterium]|nr:hypothetical protein [Syntrophomonadaceae bacterium]MDD3889439.1 hypothetical protein [Syntrophomonadaceae bacterium]
MLEPYEWKRSRTVLRRERESNLPDLVDYKNLIEALGGAYIRLIPSMKVAFNPFDIEPLYDDQIGWHIDIAGKTDDIVSLVSTMLEAQSGEKISAEERSLANRAVRMEYEERQIHEDDPESIYQEGGRETSDGVIVGKSYKEMEYYNKSAAQNRKEMIS